MRNKFLVILLLTIVTVGHAQSIVTDVSKRGTSAAPFLLIGQGARATAMGSAFVAIADDPSSMYWNPAGLASVEDGAVVFDHTNWISDVTYNYVAATYGLGGMGTIGVSFTSSSYGDMNVTTVDEPLGTGEIFSASDAVFSIGYGINLTDNFAIGFNPKFVHQSIWKMSATAFAIDMGVKYRTPFEGIILAMSISNFGTKMKMTGNSNVVIYDSDPENTGNNGNIPANLQTDEWSLPLMFRVGLGYTAKFTEDHKLAIAVDALHPSDNYESVNVGAEYSFSDVVFLRGGYRSLFLDESEESFTLGVGLKQMLLGNVAVKFDYSYADFGRLEEIQKFSVGITF